MVSLAENLIEEAAARLLRIVCANDGQPSVHHELRTRALSGSENERSKTALDLALLSLVEHKLLVRMGYGPWALYTIPPESMYQATQIAYADFPCESEISGGMAAAPAVPLGDGDATMAPAPRLPSAASPCGLATAALRRQMSPRPRPPRGAAQIRSTRFCGKRGNAGNEESAQKRARLARPSSAQASGGDPMSP